MFLLGDREHHALGEPAGLMAHEGPPFTGPHRTSPLGGVQQHLLWQFTTYTWLFLWDYTFYKWGYEYL